MELPLSTKQLDFISGSTKKVNIASGSIRSGKTLSSLILLLLRIADAPQQGSIIVVGRSSNTVYRNIFAPLQDTSLFGKLSKSVHFSRGAQTGKILGREVHVIGASDASSEERIRGMTVSLAYVDEVTLIPENFWLQLIGRLSHPDSLLIGTTNPDNPRHWLKTDYIDRKDPEFFHSHFTIDDNPSLDPKTVAFWKRQYSGLFYKRFILGEWTTAEGSIYDSFNDDVHVVDELPEMIRCLAVGIDYGTSNAFSAEVLQLGTDLNLYFTHEYFYSSRDEASQRQKTDAEYSSDLRDFLRTNDLYPMHLYVDPSAASFRAQLRRDNIPGSIQKANNRVSDGIRTVSSLLNSNQLFVHRSCSNLIREFPSYAWDPRYQAMGEDRPLKENDHALDSARYAVYSTRHTWQSKLGLPQT
ncbi:PBSX family phage terminase large subunit [Nocardiopsis alba]|uniref:PBSX family phage terminase large subunit n=1 Tax=Nocardiopsis alba TaxID=53437 RepID=UPI00339E2B1B